MASSVGLPPGVTKAEGLGGAIGMGADLDQNGTIDRELVADTQGNILVDLDTTTEQGLHEARALLQQYGLGIATGEYHGEYITSLPPEYREGLGNLARQLAGGTSTPAVMPAWAQLVSGMFNDRLPIDVHALVQYVLRQSHLESTNGLRHYADKVRFYNEVKRQIRDELTQAREVLADMAAKEDDALLADVDTIGEAYPQMALAADYVGPDSGPALVPLVDENGSPTLAETKADLDAYIKKLEEYLSSVGNDAQLANVDLQNMLQKQQQTLQMMSNLSKILHDTALAVIRKIG